MISPIAQDILDLIAPSVREAIGMLPDEATDVNEQRGGVRFPIHDGSATMTIVCNFWDYFDICVQSPVGKWEYMDPYPSEACTAWNINEYVLKGANNA